MEPRSSATHIQQAEWDIQGVQFCADLKVLPLTHYDMILGYDWLLQFSPMKIHWEEKWLKIPYGNSTVVLHGLLSQLRAGAQIQLYQLASETLQSLGAETVQLPDDVPVEVKQLIVRYSDIFASKVVFPPPRTSSHSIPLLSSATPVHIRPYRYTPALKDEIERQIQEMLKAGLIQHSSSPSSPVLLVKKKDKTSRFCVDYGHLNAITKKGQYPVPVIEEFLDELQ
jgi:hypothetical protein